MSMDISHTAIPRSIPSECSVAYPNGDTSPLQHPVLHQAAFSDEPHELGQPVFCSHRWRAVSAAEELRCRTQGWPWGSFWSFDKLSRARTADTGAG
jgi:hypothetical protein